MTRLTSVTIIYNDDQWTERKVWVPWKTEMKVLAKRSGIRSGQVFIHLKQNQTWVSQEVDNVIVPGGVYNIIFKKEVKFTEIEKKRIDRIECKKQMMRRFPHVRRRLDFDLLPVTYR